MSSLESSEAFLDDFWVVLVAQSGAEIGVDGEDEGDLRLGKNVGDAAQMVGVWGAVEG